MTALQLLDDATRADLGSYVARARRLEDDGAIRLQASGTTLAAWVGVLRGRGVMGEGTTVGLRVMALSEPAEVDAVVPLAGISDRLARAKNGLTVEVPPQRVRTSWAAQSPPRAGWQAVSEIAGDLLETVAAQGISEIANGAPAGSGASAVETLRQQVWNRPMPLGGAADGLPAGVAFAAHALGFITTEPATVYAAARWHRISTPAGHILVR